MNERLKSIRVQLGLSRKAFAEDIGINERSLVNYESGERTIPTNVVTALYEKLNINPVWLLTGQGDMRYIAAPAHLNQEEKELLDLARSSPEVIPLLKRALAARSAFAAAVEELQQVPLSDKKG